MKKISFWILLLVCSALTSAFAAESGKSEPFKYGSYQQILSSHNGEPFVMVVWSVTCSACLKEMEILKEIHDDKTDLKMVMLSVDDFSVADEVHAVLEKNGISGLESWVFSESNTQRLRYEIDPTWYGELPRAYFFNAERQRKAVSGKLSKKEFMALIQ